MKRGLLRMGDVRRLYKLLGEASELPARSKAQRFHLIEGITAILNGSLGAAVVDVDFGPQGRGRIGDYVGIAGADNDVHGLVEEMVRRGSRANPVIDALHRDQPGPGRVTTCERSDLVSDDAWYGSEFVQEVMRGARLDDSLYSCCPTAQAHVAGGVAIYRAWRDRPFEEED